MKKILIVILSIAHFTMVGGCANIEATTNHTNQSSSGSTQTTSTIDPYYQDFEAYLLTGYPEREVPLINSLAIDQCHFSVRNDPQWIAVEGGLRNFYHVVYYTKSIQTDVLSFYKDKMSSIDDEFTFGDQVQGIIGEFKVFVTTTVDKRNVTVYVTVDLPKESLVEVNPFFSDYPADLIEVEPVFTTYEQNYQVSSSGNGRIVYANYYEMPVVEQEFFDYYRDRYKDKESFQISDTGHITWKDGQYAVSLFYMKDFKRSTFVIFKNLE